MQESSTDADLRSLLQTAQNLELLQNRKRSPTGEIGFQKDLKKARTAVAEHLRGLGFTAAMLYADQAAIE